MKKLCIVLPVIVINIQIFSQQVTIDDQGTTRNLLQALPAQLDEEKDYNLLSIPDYACTPFGNGDPAISTEIDHCIPAGSNWIFRIFIPGFICLKQ